MAILSLSHVSLTFQGASVLQDITFDVPRGHVIGLIGPNGSGKTTLFNVLSGFLEPSAGTILFHGHDITRVSAAKRAQSGIGRVFQNFGIFRDMTLRENILVALEALPRDARLLLGDLSDVVDRTLAMVGLQTLASHKAGSLSGGQMRLLEIARTFASGKELFLLDEPTAGVSPKMTAQVADLIMALKRAGKTVLIVEHDLPFIRKICDRVIVMDVGRIVLMGSPQEVQSSHALKELYFGADPTT